MLFSDLQLSGDWSVATSEDLREEVYSIGYQLGDHCQGGLGYWLPQVQKLLLNVHIPVCPASAFHSCLASLLGRQKEHGLGAQGPSSRPGSATTKMCGHGKVTHHLRTPVVLFVKELDSNLSLRLL